MLIVSAVSFASADEKLREAVSLKFTLPFRLSRKEQIFLDNSPSRDIYQDLRVLGLWNHLGEFMKVI